MLWRRAARLTTVRVPRELLLCAVERYYYAQSRIAPWKAELRITNAKKLGFVQCACSDPACYCCAPLIRLVACSAQSGAPVRHSLVRNRSNTFRKARSLLQPVRFDAEHLINDKAAGNAASCASILNLIASSDVSTPCRPGSNVSF